MTSSDQSPSHNVFVYGSFQEPAVVSLILECSPVIVSAQLHGYHLYRLKGRLHPCISPSENGVIKGKKPTTTEQSITERKLMALLRIRKATTTLLYSGGLTQGTDRIARTGALLSRWISSASSSSAVVAEDESGGIYGLGSVLKEYEDYRRSLYGEITHKALLVDAVGTLLVPAQPTAQIYKNIGEKYGVEYSEAEILTRYRRAYQKPWGGSHLRYVNDARPFWQYIVTASTGCSDSQYFEELYSYFTTEQAWKLCDPDAGRVFKAIKEAGVKVAIVSNFDTRLRPLLRALRCEDWFDAVAVSAEVEAEKPNPTIFLKACELLEVNPEDAVHVGDDRRNDVWGARDAGCDAWLWGSEVTSFKQVAQRIGVKG